MQYTPSDHRASGSLTHNRGSSEQLDFGVDLHVEVLASSLGQVRHSDRSQYRGGTVVDRFERRLHRSLHRGHSTTNTCTTAILVVFVAGMLSLSGVAYIEGAGRLADALKR